MRKVLALGFVLMVLAPILAYAEQPTLFVGHSIGQVTNGAVAPSWRLGLSLESFLGQEHARGGFASLAIGVELTEILPPSYFLKSSVGWQLPLNMEILPGVTLIGIGPEAGFLLKGVGSQERLVFFFSPITLKVVIKIGQPSQIEGGLQSSILLTNLR